MRDNFVLTAYRDYSVDTVADLLLPTGLLIDGVAQYTGSLEEFVFLKGDANEIYSKSEMDFIDGVVEFCVFKDYFKKTKNGMIPCRVVSAKIEKTDILSAGIAITKIINKAIDGLNIGCIISDEGIIFTGRLFEQKDSISCFVSQVIESEEQYYQFVSDLMFCDLYDKFVDYYSYIKSVIQFPDEPLPYRESSKYACRIPYEYIEELHDMETLYGVSFSNEIERYFFENNEPKELTYSEKVKECEENLFKIESSRVNTMEMLFEAEEMERLTLETEQKNDALLHQPISSESVDDDIDEEAKALLDDPEGMIKMLKKKRGL